MTTSISTTPTKLTCHRESAAVRREQLAKGEVALRRVLGCLIQRPAAIGNHGRGRRSGASRATSHGEEVSIIVGIYNGVGKARNGSYGCFTCNVRVCWHPDCLRDHLTRKRGKEAKGEMKREERKPASGESKSHFREDDDE